MQNLIMLNPVAFNLVVSNMVRVIRLAENVAKIIFDLIFPLSPEQKEIQQVLKEVSAPLLYKKCKRYGSDLSRNRLPKGVFSVFSYKDPIIRALIWQMKFRGEKKFTKVIGDILASEIAQRTRIKNGKFLLIPIPIHSKRRKERGFNQCELICEKIVRRLPHLQYDKKILFRQIYRTKQSWGDRAERAEKIRGVFAVHQKAKKKISGRQVVLIDDVITTGATVLEAKRCLLKAGATDVKILTFAHWESVFCLRILLNKKM